MNDFRTCSDPECTRPMKARGMCKLHWARWRRQNPDAPRPRAARRDDGEPLVIVMDRVRVTNSGCWEWKLWRDPRGYGTVGKGGEGGGSRAAYRWAYELLVGPVPEGLELDHLCNNPPCVNPDHLEPVTHAENNRRRGARMTHCKRGHEFTEENTYISKAGARQCRACLASHARRYRRERRRAA